MKQQIEVRIFDPQDVLEAINQSVSEILAIEKCTFPDPWSSGSIEETLKAPGYRNTGAWIEGKLAGYLFCSYVLDETEIVKIAVAPNVPEMTARQHFIGLLGLQRTECVKITIQIRWKMRF